METRGLARVRCGKLVAVMREILAGVDDDFRWSVPECTMLTDEYLRRKEAYALAVERFFAIGYTLNDTEYSKLKTSVEVVRINLEVSGLKLENHKRVHSHAQ
jgi:hypothetical protein